MINPKFESAEDLQKINEEIEENNRQEIDKLEHQEQQLKIKLFVVVISEYLSGQQIKTFVIAVPECENFNSESGYLPYLAKVYSEKYNYSDSDHVLTIEELKENDVHFFASSQDDWEKMEEKTKNFLN